MNRSMNQSVRLVLLLLTMISTTALASSDYSEGDSGDDGHAYVSEKNPEPPYHHHAGPPLNTGHNHHHHHHRHRHPEPEPYPDKHYAPMPYAYTYKIPVGAYGDGVIAAGETKDEYGLVKGFYYIHDPDGRRRKVIYKADKDGFRAIVKSNEPGVVNHGPAHVRYITDGPADSYDGKSAEEYDHPIYTSDHHQPKPVYEPNTNSNDNNKPNYRAAS